MIFKDYKDYPVVLAKDDYYETPDDYKKSYFISPALTFFGYRLISMVFRANRKAKKGIYDRFNWAGSSYEIFDGLEKSGIKFQIEGMSNMTSFEGNAVFIGNHMSTLETMTLPIIIQPVKNVTFVVKKQLIDYPLFGPVIGARHPIVVGRENPREDLKNVMEEGRETLESGRSIIIFPQKTRTSQFDEKAFNTLGIKLAQRNKVYVVPVALVTDAWGNGKLVKEFGGLDTSKIVHFAFGEPFRVTDPAKDHQRVIDFIKSKINEWGREDIIKKYET